MAANPKIQLVVVGPVGDQHGQKAQERLEAVRKRFGANRVYCSDKYFAGADKDLLIAATDFSIVPSRYNGHSLPPVKVCLMNGVDGWS